MSYVQSLDSDELRIILCLDFDAHAPAAAVESLKQQILRSAHTLHAVEATGDYAFMFEVAAPDLAWYNDWLKSLADPFALLVVRRSASFVCRRFVRRPKDDRALWVPSDGALKRIDCSQVDKVHADGDYVKIYSRGQMWLLHSTLHAVRDYLGTTKFTQLHRSVIVRVAFIDSLMREGRHWLAQLKDGSIESVAQTHVADVLALTHSPTPQQPSSKRAELIDS